MPIHDWTRVEVAIFHDFHHSWIGEVSRILNAGLLPNDYYALIERAACFDTRLPALEDKLDNAGDSDLEPEVTDSEGGLLPSPPTMPVADEVGLEFYRHKMDVVTIRHVNGDRIVAMVEIVSPGNKRSRNALREFVRKSAALLNKQIHLLILDLHPPGRRDPDGIHGALWEYMTDQAYHLPADKPLTLAAYECDLALRAYVIHAAVSDTVADMPLFLMPGGHILVPLEATYQSAFAAVPRRWRRVLEAPSSS